MPLRVRKSFGKLFRINLSNSGVGWSVGGGGVRYGHYPGRKESGCTGNGCLIAIAIFLILLAASKAIKTLSGPAPAPAQNKTGQGR